jgi:hypothetical protein
MANFTEGHNLPGESPVLNEFLLDDEVDRRVEQRIAAALAGGSNVLSREIAEGIRVDIEGNAPNQGDQVMKLSPAELHAAQGASYLAYNEAVFGGRGDQLLTLVAASQLCTEGVIQPDTLARLQERNLASQQGGSK